MKTIVAYTLHHEDYTATLLRKAGLFWFVQDADGNEIRIPAKAVEETWEEADELDEQPAAELTGSLAGDAVLDEQPDPTDEEIEESNLADQAPSLADQVLTGPTIEAPSDTITLAELCDTYGVVPRIARRQLRSAVKAGQWKHDPRTGWTFARTDIDAVMLLITTKKRG